MKQTINIITDSEAAHHILKDRGRYACFLGAEKPRCKPIVNIVIYKPDNNSRRVVSEITDRLPTPQFSVTHL